MSSGVSDRRPQIASVEVVESTRDREMLAIGQVTERVHVLLYCSRHKNQLI